MDNFVTLLKKVSSKKSLPESWDIPKQFVLDKTIYSRVNGLKELTNKDRRERAMSFYLAYDELIVGKYTLGDERSVTTSDKIMLKLSPSPDGAILQIKVNDLLQINKKVTKKEIEKVDKNINQISSFHTHPIHFEKEVKTWGFFSDVDLNTFINSPLPTMGLVTKSYWIIVKTKNYNKFKITDYMQLYNIELEKEQPYYQNLIDYMNNSGIKVYHSEMGQIYELRS